MGAGPRLRRGRPRGRRPTPDKCPALRSGPRSRGSSSNGSTGRGRCGGSTAWRSTTAPPRWSGACTTRWRTGRPACASLARCCGTPCRRPSRCLTSPTPPPDRGGRAAAPGPPGRVPAAGVRPLGGPVAVRWADRHAPPDRVRVGVAGRAARRRKGTGGGHPQRLAAGRGRRRAAGVGPAPPRGPRRCARARSRQPAPRGRRRRQPRLVLLGRAAAQRARPGGAAAGGPGGDQRAQGRPRRRGDGPPAPAARGGLAEAVAALHADRGQPAALRGQRVQRPRAAHPRRRAGRACRVAALGGRDRPRDTPCALPPSRWPTRCASASAPIPASSTTFRPWPTASSGEPPSWHGWPAYEHGAPAHGRGDAQAGSRDPPADRGAHATGGRAPRVALDRSRRGRRRRPGRGAHPVGLHPPA